MNTPVSRIQLFTDESRVLRSSHTTGSAAYSSESSCNKKRGRPEGADYHSTKRGKKSLKAKNFCKRTSPVSPTRKKRAAALKAKDLLCKNGRSRRMLTNEEILMAVRVIYELRIAREEKAIIQQEDSDECVERVRG